MKISSLLIAGNFAFLIYTVSFAGDNTPLGARSAGIGNASVSLSDLWSVQNNQAGLGYLKHGSAGVYYQNPFMLQELSTRTFAGALPIKAGAFGLCISHFGYSAYSENNYGLAFGKLIGKNISAGVKMDYIRTIIAEYGQKSSVVAEAGIQAKPIKNLTIGVHVFNPTGTMLARYQKERIPTLLRLGGNYTFSDKVFIALETEKDMDKKAMVKAGLEYMPLKEVYLRIGISTNPALSCFGIGILLKKIRLDLSSTYHAVFGFSPQVGLSYEFDAKP